MDGIESGKTWIAWDRDEPVATITLEDTADPKLWTEWENEEPAAYVHRLVVGRPYAGIGLGAALLDWAGDRAQRAGLGSRQARDLSPTPVLTFEGAGGRPSLRGGPVPPLKPPLRIAPPRFDRITVHRRRRWPAR